MRRIKFLLGIFGLSVLMVSGHPGAVLAQGSAGSGGVDLSKYFILGSGQSAVQSAYETPASLVNVIVRNLFVLAGIILFITIFYVGYKFMAQGTKGKDEAKTILTTALTGFIIMFVAYWLVQILGIVTGIKIL